MKLQEVFSQLAYGEFAQLALGTNTEGEMLESNHPALVNHVNLGLTALYKRFNLKEGREVIALQPGVLSYLLTATDIHKIERVYTETLFEVGLNDLSNAYACATPTYNTLRVPEKVVARWQDLPDCLKTSTLEAVYRADHPQLELTMGYIDPAATEIELPRSHLEALLYFVASRVNNPIGMGQEFNAGNNWFNRYEMECQRLEGQNLQVDRGSEREQFREQGWV